MQIEEEGAGEMSVAQIVERKEEQDKNSGSDGFEFQLISIDDPRVFPNFKTKENQDRFFKW
jgi:hypothetical protein